MRAPRILFSTLLAVALVPFAAAPAMAAPPGNDVPGGADVIHLGDTVTQDTTEATTDADDTALNENCGAPETGASVWYTYTPAVDRKVVLDAGESDYEVGLMVFKGTPTPESLITCGPVGAGLRAKAGKTYYVMAFNDREQSGGSLVLSVKNAPTPSAHVTIAKRGVAFHPGGARIHGTYSCRHAENFGGVDVRLFQRAGRLKIQAERGTGALCDGKSHRWSVKLVSSVGLYARGPAVAKATAFACGLLECRVDRAKRHVRLAWAKGHHRQQVVKPSAGRAMQPRPLFGTPKLWPHR
jgi:hypothetical protein